MEFETILLEKKDQVATISFNRPDKMNAASPAVFQDLDNALTDIENDDDIRVVILTGKGEAFSAGADVGKFEFDKIVKGIEFIENVARPFLHFESLPKPVIAAVNGYAYGFGTGITLTCDVVIASEKARFSTREVNWGQIPIETLLRGAEILGKRTIAYMALTGATFNAEEAKAVGLVNKVVPHDQLMEEAWKIADGMKKGAPLAQKLIKKVLNRKAPEEWAWTTMMMPTIFSSEDVAEARAAFMEKRKPEFKGR
ncbi:MAG: enoyl-CoA hydratase/isomerase family protein [Dehalococcoidia bacterium]|nr:enoyl-CoA hydratase/isomerase family protein [Dehalococcoidia bacterium]